ncbi:brain protein I3-like isoform X3 [Acanthaster planci]|uniref:Membrane protein BRI3 n=1 Tax=Acanthaster planci TaxID=133434 RepID=A0A8B7XYM2_ACAPL|nr:brain protein I3-like isoform X3 [Acanthaster planci]
MDPQTPKEVTAPGDSEPPPYNPSWTYPPVGESAPAPYPPPAGYPPPQNAAYPPPAQGNAYPPPTNYSYPPGQMPQPAQVTVTTTTVPQSTATHQIVMVNTCPNCRSGVLQERFPPCAVLLAIFFFPLGVFCCLAMRERVCTNCNATFS